MSYLRTDKLKLNPGKSDILMVSWRTDQGLEVQPVLDGVALPLKGQGVWEILCRTLPCLQM